MKKLLKIYFPLLLLLCGSHLSLSAQDHIVKVRLFGLPDALSNFYSVGIGYEKLITNKQSVQLLYNYYGYNNQDNDGDALTAHSVVPEYRRYLGQRVAERFRRSAFIGIFTEFTTETKDFTNFDSPAGAKLLMERKRIIVSPGIQFGKNFHVSDRCHLDFYVGPKYRLIRQQSTFAENGSSTQCPSW